MRFIRFQTDRIGVIDSAAAVDVTDCFDLLPRWPAPPGDPVARQLSSVARRLAADGLGDRPRHALEGLRLDCPLTSSNKIVGAPVNYRAHIDEANADAEINAGKTFTTLEDYGLFLKANSSLAGPHDGLRLTFSDRRTDHEVELAAIIGTPCRDVTEGDALAHVAAYAVGLDMSVRGKEAPSYRKSPDGYCILGPALVTPDEVEDPDNLALWLSVNGTRRQDANTSQLILGVAQVIAYASKAYTLFPGDIILTGTPEGVGPVGPGDLIEAEVEHVGALSFRVSGAED